MAKAKAYVMASIEDLITRCRPAKRIVHPTVIAIIFMRSGISSDWSVATLIAVLNRGRSFPATSIAWKLGFCRRKPPAICCQVPIYPNERPCEDSYIPDGSHKLVHWGPSGGLHVFPERHELGEKRGLKVVQRLWGETGRYGLLAPGSGK